MENVVLDLVKRYETGGLSRRDLIRGIALLAAGATVEQAVSAQGAPDPIPWAPLVDHIQINSRDPRKSAEFYTRVMGMDLLRVGPPNDRTCCPDTDAFLGVGKRLLLAVRKREPFGVIDHWAMLAPGYNVEKFNGVLKGRGGAPAKHDLAGQYVQDPDGALCQLMGAPGPA